MLFVSMGTRGRKHLRVCINDHPDTGAHVQMHNLPFYGRNEFLEVVSSHQVYYLSNTSSTVIGPVKHIHSCFTGGNTAWSHPPPFSSRFSTQSGNRELLWLTQWQTAELGLNSICTGLCTRSCSHFLPCVQFSPLLTKMSRSHYPHLKYFICRKLSLLPW